MATPYPSLGGDDRKRSGDRLTRLVFHAVALGAIAGAPVATVSLWLLLTDPAVASEVAEGGSVLPVARAFLLTLGRAIAACLAML